MNGGVNIYIYSENDPINITDQEGRAPAKNSSPFKRSPYDPKNKYTPTPPLPARNKNINESVADLLKEITEYGEANRELRNLIDELNRDRVYETEKAKRQSAAKDWKTNGVCSPDNPNGNGPIDPSITQVLPVEWKAW